MATEHENETGALVVIEPTTAMAVFQNADSVQAIIAQIRELTTSEVQDASTAKGRAEIKSLAFKIKKSKTYLDGVGKALVDDLKDLPKKIDANRKFAREQLDALHDEIRQPLTEWEAEQERIAAEKAASEQARIARIQRIQDDIAGFKAAPLAMIGKSASVIEQAIGAMNEPFASDFDDKYDEAMEAWSAARNALQSLFAQQHQIEESARIERERIIAEQAVQREREANEQRIIAERMAAQQAEQARIAAEQRAALAEQNAAAERVAAEKRAEAERIASEQRILDAAQAERDRIAALSAAAEKEQAERDADKEHRKTVNNAAVTALVESAGIDIEAAKKVVMAIYKQQIPSIKITY